MDLQVGSIYEGKVTGITKFGAFVSLPGGKSGMVHISEVANAYVDDIHNYLTCLLYTSALFGKGVNLCHLFMKTMLKAQSISAA